MDTTSISLLRRLQEMPTDNDWSRFVDIYSPLLFRWSRRQGLSIEDSVDLVQEVLMTLIEKLRSFSYDPSKSFRAWLRTIVVNRAIDFQRSNNARRNRPLEESLASQLIAPDTQLYDEAEYRRLMIVRSLQLIKESESELTFQAGWLQLVEGMRASDVAQRLDISINSAYLAKSRVLSKLRSDLEGFLD